MRISQCWDEVTGDWTIKGSLDLSKFLKRLGIEKKEVTLTENSDCRASEVVSNFTHNEMDVNNIEWTQNCTSLVSDIKDEASLRPVIPGLFICKEVNGKSFEDLLPSKANEPIMPDRSSTGENTVQAVMPSRDSGVIINPPESEHCLEISNCDRRSGKLSCEEPQHQETCPGGSSRSNDTETIGSKEDSMERKDAAECRQLSCWKGTESNVFDRETVEEKFFQGGLFFKRRKIGEGARKSYNKELKLPNSQSAPPSPLQSQSSEIFRTIHENFSSATGECSERASTPYEGRVLSNLKDMNECSSSVVSKGTDLRLSFGSEGRNPLQRQSLSPMDSIWNRSKKGSELLPNGPVHKMYMLALEAPVCKSQEEYEQIVLAGKAALGGGVLSGRHGGMQMSSVHKAKEEDNRITKLEKQRKEKGAFEMTMRPRTQAVKNVPFCDQKSKVSCFQSTTAGKSRLGGVALDRASTTERKAGEAPVQKPIEEDVQTILAAKETLVGTAHESNVGLKRGAGEIFRSVATTEESRRNDTLRSFKDHLVREKQGKSLKRKVFSSKDVRLRKLSKPDREPDHADAGTTSCLSDHEDSIAARRKRSNRIKLLRASNPAETASSCLSHSGGINGLKRKASKMSFITEHGGRNGSKTEKEPDQAQASDLYKFRVKKLKKTDSKSLKKLAQQIGQKAVLEAGFRIDYRPRRGKLSFDAVYISPKGSSYWSLPKAWQALGDNKKKGKMKVQKVLIQQVMSQIGADDKLRLAFERLDRFSGKCSQEVMNRGNLTYAELSDILIGDLHVLKKHIQKSKGKKGVNEERMNDNQLGRKKFVKADLKTSSGSLPIKQRGRKRKQEVDTVPGEVDCKTLIHKVYSRLKHVQGGSLWKQDKSKSSLMKGRSIDSSKGRNKTGSSSFNTSPDKRRSSLKGSLQKDGIELKQESLQRQEKALKPRAGLRLEVRPSSSCMDDGSEELSCQSNRTVISWMIGRGAVSETEKVSFVDQVSKEVLKEGLLRREGILCRCCKRVYTVKGFKEHDESQERGRHCDLLFGAGKTFLDCQLKAWNTENQLRQTRNYKGVSANDTNDDTCLLCGDGGVLLCCDFCPSTFHASCLQLDIVPDGKWYCPKCRCGVCKGTDGFEEQAVCSQCEHRYHIACLHGGHATLGEQFVCGDPCRKIYSGLTSLIGITHPLGKGFSWTLLHCYEEPQTEDLKIVTENNSKLAVALLVLKECFNPMDDPRTNIDMITQAAYNRRSQFCRLNYMGFYTVVLERDGEIISVATIRIHGARVAEMPLIGTRHKYRRQGMCRLLVGAIEKLLSSLEVVNFILPAISELYETWTQAFCFRPLDLSLRSQIKDISMMMFPGTDLLYKSLLRNSAVAKDDDHC